MNTHTHTLVHICIKTEYYRYLLLILALVNVILVLFWRKESIARILLHCIANHIKLWREMYDINLIIWNKRNTLQVKFNWKRLQKPNQTCGFPFGHFFPLLFSFSVSIKSHCCSCVYRILLEHFILRAVYGV